MRLKSIRNFTFQSQKSRKSMQKIFIYAIRWEKREMLKVFMDRKDIFVFFTHHPTSSFRWGIKETICDL